MDLKKLWKERTDPTGKRLFFQVLRQARWLKHLGWKQTWRRHYLMGMLKVIDDNREDFTIADNLRDYWKCQNSGAA